MRAAPVVGVDAGSGGDVLAVAGPMGFTDGDVMARLKSEVRYIPVQWNSVDWDEGLVRI